MKRYLILFTFLFQLACQESESIIDNPTEIYIQTNDICGVWTNQQDSMYYLALYPSGRYTFCLSDKLIGSGTYILKENTLTLNDGYFFTSNNIRLSLDNGYLKITGCITNIDNINQTINYELKYNPTEELSSSLIGYYKKDVEEGGNAYYSETITELNFISDNIFTYRKTGKYKNSGSWKTIVDQTRYYVYRKPYTYCYLLNNSPKTLEVYDFKFMYSNDYGYLDGFSLDSWRVK